MMARVSMSGRDEAADHVRPREKSHYDPLPDDREAVHVRHGPDVALHHGVRDLAKSLLRPHGEDIGRHDVSHGQLARQLHGVERREPDHLLGRLRGQEGEHGIRGGERARERPHDLEVQRGLAQRHDDVLGLQDVLELHTRPRKSGTTSAGRFITEMPACANAAIFSAAVPAEPEIIAPAWPMRRPGGAVWPAMKPITGLVIPCCTNSAACCSSVPPISPITTTASVAGSAWKADRQWMKFVPIRGSPPMPMQVDWPNPLLESWCTIS